MQPQQTNTVILYRQSPSTLYGLAFLGVKPTYRVLEYCHQHCMLPIALAGCCVFVRLPTFQKLRPSAVDRTSSLLSSTCTYPRAFTYVRTHMYVSTVDKTDPSLLRCRPMAIRGHAVDHCHGCQVAFPVLGGPNWVQHSSMLLARERTWTVAFGVSLRYGTYTCTYKSMYSGTYSTSITYELLPSVGAYTVVF